MNQIVKTSYPLSSALVTGTSPLTPIQHWFFEQNRPQPHYFNQSFLLSVPSEWKPELLEQIVQHLLLHHDALRLRFVLSDSNWEQTHALNTDNTAFSFFDLSKLPTDEQTTAIETTAAQLQASLNLSKDLVRVALFRLGIDKPSRLLIIIHHLVVDDVSWRILLEDLQTVYQQLCDGKGLALPPKTTSFKDWAHRLAEYAQSQPLKSELTYWLSKSPSSVSSIPVDYARGANTVASASTIKVSLNSAQTTALLQDVPKAYNTQILDVLLTALVQALGKWTNSNSVLLNLEGHGREDIVEDVDLSRTIGWFTTIFPVFLELRVTDNPGDALKLVKEQLRAIPNKGIGYGLLRYLSRDTEIVAQLQALGQAQISFNYLGQFDQVLNTSSIQLASESAGPEHNLHGNRTHLLDITGIILGNQLQINWTYSTNVHEYTTIESLAQEFILTLRELIAHCLAPQSGGYTPSDFELVNISQLELDQVLATLALKQELGKQKWKNIEDIYPLSPMQQGMLFHSLYAPESGVYFEQLSCILRGNVNVQAFGQAWQQVVARHSVLRTALEWSNLEEPLQVVYRQLQVTVETHDWRELSIEQQQQQLEVFLHSQRQQSFQLSVAPLMRLNLIQLDVDCYQFVWSHDHILLDGWSVALVFKDLLYFYQAFSQSESLRYEPTVPYRKYIAWLQKQDLALAEEFWRQKLEGFIAPTPLTVDKLLSNPEQSHSNHSEQQIQLSVQATADIQSFARQHQLGVNNLVQATWALLLSRYSGEADVVFGATVSGRPPVLPGVESMVGLFINTLPVRVQLSGEVSVLPWLQQLQLQQVEREQYTYTSLVDIQGWSDFPRGMPLFESIVIFTDYSLTTSLQQQVGSIEIHNVCNFERTNYPLVLEAIPGEELSLGISYNQNRFDAATISRILKHLQTLLERIVADPQQRIAELSLLTATERYQLLVEWNNTRRDYLLDKCIHELFESQVERTPDAVAVVFKDQWLSYGELNERANQVAYILTARGVGIRTYVPVLMDRSIELVIALLAIMKAGAAFVPLDVFWPIDRLKHVLEELNSEVILVNQAIAHQEVVLGLSFLVIDRLATQDAMPNLNINIDCGEPIYAIYTSGSTGKPKAVVVPHQGIINRFLWMNEFFGRESALATLQTTRHVYDSAVWQIFWPLINGGKTVIPSPDLTMSADDLTNLIQSHRVTITDFVPSVFNIIVPQLTTDTEVQQKLSSLQTVIVGGEEITPATTYTFLDYFPSVRVVNLYGPTEASIGCICYRVTGKQGNKIPIGKPIANVHVLILDQHRHLVPVGIPGEIYLSGICLALGYLNDESKTKEVFVDHQFEEIGYNKLYKTGDLARYLPDGNIEFLGRIDHQVKIRGIRIELGEIEALLAQHPGVQQTVVIAREDRSGNKHLVGYVVPNQKQVPTVEELRYFLQQKLPDYMVPSIFMMLESIQLTSSGKVDRRILSALELPQLSVETDFASPRTPTEEILVNLWTEILGVERVGIHNNFFELGGHSLLATQVISRLRKYFSLELSLQHLFKAPTIASLAQSIEALREVNQNFYVSTEALEEEYEKETLIPQLRPGKAEILTFEAQTYQEPWWGKDNEYPLSPELELYWVVSQLTSGDTFAPTFSILNSSIWECEFDPVLFQRACDLVVERNEILRTRLIRKGAWFFQILSKLLPSSSKNKGSLSKFKRLEQAIIALLEKPNSVEARLLHRLISLKIQLEVAVVRQKVLAPQSVSWTYHNYEYVSDEMELQSIIEEITTKESKCPFDMETGPLLRCTVIKHSSNIHRVIVIAHHGFVDLISIEQVSDEVRAVYQALLRNELDSLAVRPQYSDYATRWASLRNSASYRSDIDFWQKHFAQCKPTVVPPQPNTYHREDFSISAPVAKETAALIHSYCQQILVPASAFFLAAYYLFLYQITSKSHLYVVVNNATRPDFESEATIGTFVQLFPLVVNLTQIHTIADVIQASAQNIFAGLDHRKVSLPRLVSHEICIAAAMMKQPGCIFQVIQTTEEPKPHRRLPRYASEASDWQFSVSINGSGQYNINVAYNIAFYTHEYVENLFEKYQQVLAIMVTNPLGLLEDVLKVEAGQKLCESSNHNTNHRNINKSL